MENGSTLIIVNNEKHNLNLNYIIPITNYITIGCDIYEVVRSTYDIYMKTLEITVERIKN